MEISKNPNVLLRKSMLALTPILDPTSTAKVITLRKYTRRTLASHRASIALTHSWLRWLTWWQVLPRCRRTPHDSIWTSKLWRLQPTTIAILIYTKSTNNNSSNEIPSKITCPLRAELKTGKTWIKCALGPACQLSKLGNKTKFLPGMSFSQKSQSLHRERGCASLTGQQPVTFKMLTSSESNKIRPRIQAARTWVTSHRHRHFLPEVNYSQIR